MALKAIVQIREFDYDPNSGLAFTLRIICLDPSALADPVITGAIGIAGGDAASVVNTKVAQFVKDYCTTHYDTEWGVFDTVRILAAVDSVL